MLVVLLNQFMTLQKKILSELVEKKENKIQNQSYVIYH